MKDPKEKAHQVLKKYNELKKELNSSECTALENEIKEIAFDLEMELYERKPDTEYINDLIKSIRSVMKQFRKASSFVQDKSSKKQHTKSLPTDKDSEMPTANQWRNTYHDLTENDFLKVPNTLIRSVTNAPLQNQENNNLRPLEFVLLLELINLSQKYGYCYAEDKYFAKHFDCTDKTISNALRHLENRNYIVRKTSNKTTPDFAKRHIHVNLNTIKSLHQKSR